MSTSETFKCSWCHEMKPIEEKRIRNAKSNCYICSPCKIAKNKEDYAKHKDKRNEIITICPCGGKYKYYTKSDHLGTKRHIKYMSENPIINK